MIRRAVVGWLAQLGRRAVGLLWCCAWWFIAQLFHDPWRHLGGMVGERWRWGESYVAITAALLGYVAGDHWRSACAARAEQPSPLVCWSSGVRRILLPSAACIAALLLGLSVAGIAPAVGIATVGLVTFWGGLDLGLLALPLLAGEPIAAPSTSRPTRRHPRFALDRSSAARGGPRFDRLGGCRPGRSDGNDDS